MKEEPRHARRRFPPWNPAPGGSRRPRPGRWNRTRRSPRGYAASVAVAAVLLGGVWTVTRMGDAADRCAAGRPALRVAAAPDIAPVVSAVGARLARAERPGCVDIAVTARSTGDVVDALIRGTDSPPDVWIPGSSVELTRPDGGGSLAAGTAPSIATSPLVLAVTRNTAGRLRAGAGRPSLADLASAAAVSSAAAASSSAGPASAGPASAGSASAGPASAAGDRTNPPRLSLPGPGSVFTSGAIMSLSAATAGRRDGRAALTALVRDARTDPPGAVRGGPRNLAVTGAAARPATEQAVWAAAAARADIVAVYPPPTGFLFDYPYAVLTLDPAYRRTASMLLSALVGAAGQEAVRAARFRDIRGVAGAALAGGVGTGGRHAAVDGRHPVAVRPPDSDALAAADRLFDLVRRDARILAVLDVSGSMGERVAGANGATRVELAKRAAAGGLALYPDTTRMGLWIFSTNLTAGTDHRELVPVSPLKPATGRGADGRARLARALAGVRHRPGGNTGLYDTTLAAVRALRQNWDPDRVNAVILLTDGANVDDRGITLDRLLATLLAERNSGRPVPVITIAYGPDSDARVLRAISAATGGAAYSARDPRDIRRVFFDAIGQRACRPQCH